MELHYFSWLRNRAGTSKETVSPPPDVRTLKELISWLCGQNAKYPALFSYRNVVNISVNGQLVEDWEQCALKNDDKVSFFSPMAGG
jgi:molybdopterin synthase sulfur carrier subunit